MYMQVLHTPIVAPAGSAQRINIKEVVAQKNSALARRIPAFAFRVLDRILHVEELNAALALVGEQVGLDFVNAMTAHLDVDISVDGEQHLATTARPVVASNHPLGGLDGIALLSVIGRYHPDLIVPVNDFLMNIPNLRSLFVPINKYGDNWENFSRLADLFASEKTILHFPAGLCSRRSGHLVRDLEWKKTVVTRARVCGRSIIPTFVAGTNSSRFYRIAQLRERTGVRFNAEMMLLVDEMFRACGSAIPVRFGAPIPPELFDRRCSDAQWAALLRRYVYALGSGASFSFAQYAHAAANR